ncbi:MAG: ferritin [Candidatus Heimdallarchaeota archaeon]|nr:ferritin [Candidatus Heimdallarchaeota archaeon]
MALISKKMNDALNIQIKEELESGYLYLSMSFWLKEKAYHNLANWYYVQAEEEYKHAKKFIDYIIETGGNVELLELSKPKFDWQSIKEIIEAGYKHEQHITKTIEGLWKLAEELKEIQPRSLLQWFIDEQIEEEANAQELIDKYAGFKNDQLFDHHTHREED